MLGLDFSTTMLGTGEQAGRASLDAILVRSDAENPSVESVSAVTSSPEPHGYGAGLS